MSEENKEIETRSGKADKARYVSLALDLIGSNKSKSQITSRLMTDFSLTASQANRFYLKAAELVEQNNSEKVKTVRNKRIYSLQKDTEEAYQNYKNEADGALKVKWYEIYQKTKAQLDNYYPNGLKPEAEKDELKVTIQYCSINSLDDEEQS